MEKSIIPSHLKSIVSCTALAQGGKKEWEFAYSKFNTSNSATEKDDMLEAMSCSGQAWILKRFKIKIMCGNLVLLAYHAFLFVL